MPYGFDSNGVLDCEEREELGEIGDVGDGGNAVRSLGEDGKLDQAVLDRHLLEEDVEDSEEISDFREDLLECLERDLVKVVALLNSDRTGEVVIEKVGDGNGFGNAGLGDRADGMLTSFRTTMRERWSPF